MVLGPFLDSQSVTFKVFWQPMNRAGRSCQTTSKRQTPTSRRVLRFLQLSFLPSGSPLVQPSIVHPLSHTFYPGVTLRSPKGTHRLLWNSSLLPWASSRAHKRVLVQHCSACVVRKCWGKYLLKKSSWNCFLCPRWASLQDKPILMIQSDGQGP